MLLLVVFLADRHVLERNISVEFPAAEATGNSPVHPIILRTHRLLRYGFEGLVLNAFKCDSRVGNLAERLREFDGAHICRHIRHLARSVIVDEQVELFNCQALTLDLVHGRMLPEQFSLLLPSRV